MDERKSFEENISWVLNKLMGAALRLAKNRDDAEDLVSETIARAWKHRNLLKDASHFKPWIFRILSNTFISDYRKKGVRFKTEPLGEQTFEGEKGFSLFEELHQPFLLWWSNPEKEFLNKILRKDIEKAVDALPENFRIAVVLSDLEGFSYKEMAEILKLPVGTIRSRLARGRGLLQKSLWDHAVMAGLVKPRDPEKMAGVALTGTEAQRQSNLIDGKSYERDKKPQM